jgi:hypothetical protein
MTKGFVVGATLFAGLLAGMSANKVLVQLPAWAEVGVLPWANFTQTADQGLGLILFPVIGGVALLLTVAAVIAFHRDRTAPRSGARPINTAAVLAITALIVTVVLLAPSRLGLSRAAGNVVELQRLFASVTRVWQLKALLHVLTFGANLWALATILRDDRRAGDRRDVDPDSTKTEVQA